MERRQAERHHRRSPRNAGGSGARRRRRAFAANGKQYVDPTLVLFSDSVASACGYADAAMGPFYCPGDRKVYIDLNFYRDLRERFNAPGDFAEA